MTPKNLLKPAILVILLLACGASLHAQCGSLVFNPITGTLDCAGKASVGVSGSGTLCWQTSNTGTLSFGACSGSAATAWSSLTAPAANLSLSMTTFTNTFTTGTGTSTSNIWTFQDTTGNTGTGNLFSVSTVGTSTMKPFLATAQGTVNGVQMDSTGKFSFIGGGVINANQVNGGTVPTSATVLGSNGSNQPVAATTTGSGATVALATSPVLTTPHVTTIDDGNGNPFVASTATASAVDSVTITNAAAANPATVTVSATGSDTNINLNLVSKGSGAVQCNGSTCGGGGGTGNAAAVVTLAFSATPTFTCPSSSAGTIVDFQAASNAPITLTGNITSSTLASCTAGSILNFLLKQDATGNRQVTWPTGFPASQPNLAANVTTTMTFYWDGANARCLSCSDSTAIQGTEGAAPGANPVSGFEYLWFDNTANTALLTNSAGNQHKMPRCAGSTDQCASSDLSDSASISNAKKRAIAFSIGDPQNSSALTTSNVSYLASVPFACTISAYNLAIDAGTITVKFWKIATGTAIPTSSNSINTSGVSIASGTAIHSTTVSDFTTTSVAANDIMAMAVTAVATAKFVSGVLECDN